MTRLGLAALALLTSFPVLAQSNGAPAPGAQPYAQQPPPQGSGPAPGYAAPPPQGYYAPAQPPAQPPPAPSAQPQRYPEAQSVSPSTAGTGSQQVVVNPPTQAAPQPNPPPNAPNVTVNPPAASSSYAQGQPVIVEREVGRSPLETVAVTAAYGALAGALVGAGVALLDQGNNWGRDLMLGAGAGILVGAVVGGIQAYGQSNRVAMDGLGSPDRDRTASAPERATVVSLVAGRF